MSESKERREWTEEEDLYCVERFIKNYLKRLIETGKVLNTAEIKLETKLYIDYFANNRNRNSIRMKFQNIEYLAFSLVKKCNNPFNIKVLKRLDGYSDQLLKAWENQIEKYATNIDKWTNKIIDLSTGFSDSEKKEINELTDGILNKLKIGLINIKDVSISYDCSCIKITDQEEIKIYTCWYHKDDLNYDENKIKWIKDLTYNIEENTIISN